MSKLIYLDRVKQATTTTGTGDIVFTGSVPGFSPLASHPMLEYGSSFPYVIEAVDTGGVPTGEWETGIGRLRGVGDANPTRMRRLAVRSSSNSGSLVDFSAGTKLVSICVMADLLQGQRSTTAEFWVRPDGNGNNDGGANAADRAFSSVMDAVAAAAKFCEMPGAAAKVMIAPGTYYEDPIILPPYPRCVTDQLTIGGAGSNRDDVVLANGIQCAGDWGITWLKLARTSAGHAAHVHSGGRLKVWDVDFGTVGNGAQVFVEENSVFRSDYHYVSGGAKAHFRAESGGVVTLAGSIDFLANAAYSGAFADCLRGGGYFDLAAGTFALNGFSVTGKRYDLRGNGVCWTNGGSASFLPGDAAGTTASGGQYL